MPLYEIQHICPLTSAQCDSLASAITTLHATRFTTPKMFVNVKFTPSSEHNTYVGGVPRRGNHILAHVRVGPSRSQADWNALVQDVVDAWNRIVPMPRAKGGRIEDYGLRSCIVVGGLIAGWEAGFVLPKAGEDVQWLRDHWVEFGMKAKGGDEEFQGLVDEVGERGLLNGEGKSGMQRLEEALGWGDSA